MAPAERRQTRSVRRALPALSLLVSAAAAAGSAPMTAGGACAPDDSAAAMSLDLRWLPPEQGGHSQSRLAWTNLGTQPLALWTHTDSDAGRQHDALWLAQAGRVDALIAPRKNAAPRFCRLEPGDRYTMAVDLQAWSQRLRMAPEGDLQLQYRVEPATRLPSGTLLPACNAALAAGPARLWTGCLRATR